MTSKMPFNDPPTTVQQQIELLSTRGMTIDNKETATSFLSSCSYYRYCGYALHYEIFTAGQRTHQYKRGTRFEDVVYLYQFDSRLRNLLLKYIEPIEIAFRTAICLEMANKYHDAHWFMNENLFNKEFKHSEFIKICEEAVDHSSRELFVKNYIEKYSKPNILPCWMMIEVVSFSTWSRLYSSLINSEDRKLIAKHLNSNPEILKSWIHVLCILRNYCAHYSRIWDRRFSQGIRIPYGYDTWVTDPSLLSSYFGVVSFLLTSLGKRDDFIDELKALMMEYKDIPYSKMGLFNNWIKE